MANRTGRTNVRWMMVLMAFLGTAINYIDRANLGLAIPSMQKELHLGPEDIGLVLGAFFWTYALFQLPSGWFVDKVGPRIAYTVAVTWWSFFTAAAAVARGFFSLFGIRLLLGLGEAPAYPTNAKIVAEWFPRSERAFATSIFDSGARVGTFIAFLICPTIIAYAGWRMSFIITGSFGLVWAVVWYRFYRHPDHHAWASDEEKAHIEAGKPVQVVGAAKVPYSSLFKYRTIRGMMLGFFCLNFVMYFFITWFPTYLAQARGFALLKMGLYGSIPSLVGVPMGYLGGLTSDYLVRRGVRLTLARKIPIVAGMTVASCIGLAVIVPSAVHAMILLSLCNGSICFAAASIWSLPADVAPTPGHIASIGGIQNFASNTAGICTTYVVGKLVAKTGSFVAPLMVAGGFALVGALSYLFIVQEIEPLKIEPESPTV